MHLEALARPELSILQDDCLNQLMPVGTTQLHISNTNYSFVGTLTMVV